MASFVNSNYYCENGKDNDKGEARKKREKQVARDVHGYKLRVFFNPTQSYWVEKFAT